MIDDYVEFTNKLPKLNKKLDDYLLDSKFVEAVEVSNEINSTLRKLNLWIMSKITKK